MSDAESEKTSEKEDSISKKVKSIKLGTKEDAESKPIKVKKSKRVSSKDGEEGKTKIEGKKKKGKTEKSNSVKEKKEKSEKKEKKKEDIDKKEKRKKKKEEKKKRKEEKEKEKEGKEKEKGKGGGVLKDVGIDIGKTLTVHAGKNVINGVGGIIGDAIKGPKEKKNEKNPGIVGHGALPPQYPSYPAHGPPPRSTNEITIKLEPGI